MTTKLLGSWKLAESITDGKIHIYLHDNMRRKGFCGVSYESFFKKEIHPNDVNETQLCEECKRQVQR